MARPYKKKIISHPLICNRFIPAENKAKNLLIRLSLEELETLRLIDVLNLTQNQCSQIMGIARTTVQSIYKSARKKTAAALTQAIELVIEGGDYHICNQISNKTNNKNSILENKGEYIMKIAVTYENGKIFQHFGHTEQFKIYETDGQNNITATQILNTNGTGHGALAQLLKENNINVLICGGIGGGARNALAEAQIELFGGVEGDADKAVENYLKGTLSYNPEVMCKSHSHNGSNHSHSCGEHSCGEKCKSN